MSAAAHARRTGDRLVEVGAIREWEERRPGRFFVTMPDGACYEWTPYVLEAYGMGYRHGRRDLVDRGPLPRRPRIHVGST